MTFTDDQVQSLKSNIASIGSGYIDGKLLLALLARLKAAEKCIKRHLLDCPDVSHCNCTHVWRKVAGK